MKVELTKKEINTLVAAIGATNVGDREESARYHGFCISSYEDTDKLWRKLGKLSDSKVLKKDC